MTTVVDNLPEVVAESWQPRCDECGETLLPHEPWGEIYLLADPHQTMIVHGETCVPQGWAVA